MGQVGSDFGIFLRPLAQPTSLVLDEPDGPKASGLDRPNASELGGSG